MEEQHSLQTFATKSVEIDETSDTINVMTVILTLLTGVMETATLKLDGCASEEILGVLNPPLISAQKSAEMVSTGAGTPVMTGTFKMAMAVLLTAFKSLDLDVLEEMLRLLIFVQSCVEMGSMQGFLSVMMRICKMEMDVMRIVKQKPISNVQEVINTDLMFVLKCVEMVSIVELMNVMIGTLKMGMAVTRLALSKLVGIALQAREQHQLLLEIVVTKYVEI